MNFLHLPDDVHLHILSILTYIECYSYNQWKLNLEYLGICQKWRYLAIPFVCKWAGFSIEEADNFNELQTGQLSMVSNIDAVISIGSNNMVKHLDIQISCDKTPFPLLFHITNLLANHSQVWKSIQRLNIEISYSYSEAEAMSVNTSLFVPDINKAIDILHALLPNLNSMELQDFYNNAISQAFYHKLVNQYSHNIKTLISYQPLTLDKQILSSLACLKMSRNTGEHFALPLLNADTLTELDLQNVPSAYDWTGCAGFGKGAKIIFANLQKLAITYDENNQTTSNSTLATLEKSHDIQLYFPKLRCLKIVNEPPQQSVFRRSILSSTISEFEFEGCLQSLQLLLAAKLPIIKKLSLYIVGDGNEDLYLLFESVDKAAKLGHILKKLKLRMINLGIAELPDNIACPPVTHLYLDNMVDLYAALKLMSKLNQLKYVSLFVVEPETAPIDDLLKQINSSEPLKPISCSINSLQIFHAAWNGNNDLCTLLIYLLLRLPAIEKVNAHQFGAGELSRINEYSSKYPHISNIHFVKFN
ncbi:hypothetical protein BX667DRAFT_510446 [Coemansia mojavensis]|nr:hypothetical protein BX667DRAFT_510446 [Coemansia mojavensis]